jgi:nicotinate-nucleotide pyrophosphorylase (carboxylating)
MVMIKDNHIAAVGGVEAAIRRARERASFAKKIEVEVGGKSDAIAAARARVDVIMLDNMTAEETRSTMGGLEAEGLREGLLVESSGGVTLENVEEIASTGVDVISVGRLTHSARFLDLALRFVK